MQMQEYRNANLMRVHWATKACKWCTKQEKRASEKKNLRKRIYSTRVEAVSWNLKVRRVVGDKRKKYGSLEGARRNLHF